MPPTALFSGLRNSACRALACAGTAVDALICVDFKLAVSHADCTNGALSLAGAASYASIADFICHDLILLITKRLNNTPITL